MNGPRRWREGNLVALVHQVTAEARDAGDVGSWHEPMTVVDRPRVSIAGDPRTTALLAELLASALVGSEIHAGARPLDDADLYVAVIPPFSQGDADAVAGLRSLVGPDPGACVAVVDVGPIDASDGWRLDPAGSSRRFHQESAWPLHRVCARYVPVALDLWHRAQAIDQADVRSLMALTATGSRELLLDDLASAELFLRTATGRASEVREQLFRRLGMHILRVAVASNVAPVDARELRSRVLDDIGASALIEELRGRLFVDWPAARERRVLRDVDALAEALRVVDQTRARHLREVALRYRAGCEVARSDSLAQWIAVSEHGNIDELRRIATSSNMYARLGIDPEAPDDELAERGRSGGLHWLNRAANPLAEPGAASLADAVKRWYDLILAMTTENARG